MANFSVTVNMGDVIPRLSKFATSVKPNVTAALEAAMARGATTAQQSAPVRTGFLKSSIQVEGISLIASAGYAGFQEFGTRYIPAKHFMQQGMTAIVDYLSSSLPTSMQI